MTTVYLTLKPGEHIPQFYFTGRYDHVVRFDDAGVTYIMDRLSQSPTLHQLITPVTYMMEIRLCHLWHGTMTIKSETSNWEQFIPVNNTVYTKKDMFNELMERNLSK